MNLVKIKDKILVLVKNHNHQRFIGKKSKSENIFRHVVQKSICQRKIINVKSLHKRATVIVGFCF